jgi:hypothetical protein
MDELPERSLGFSHVRWWPARFRRIGNLRLALQLREWCFVDEGLPLMN